MILPRDRVVLAVNAGSGSVAAVAFRAAADDGRVDTHEALEPLWSMHVIRHTDPQRVGIDGAGARRDLEVEGEGADAAVAPGLDCLWDGPTAVVGGPEAVVAVGHRIVHGGPTLDAPVPIDAGVIDAIDEASRLAPLHNPPGLELLRLARERLPDAVHVACFDTAFHATIPLAARAYGGPAEWIERGLLRYGFHGIAHGNAARRAARALGRELAETSILSVHLGGGCSAAAIEGGASVATTMGFTPTDGMVMATRSGAVDPGLLLYLAREDGLAVDAMETLLDERSGLLGLSGGRSGDAARLHALAEDGDEAASRALAIYTHRARREIAALRPALRGLDALVFAGSAVVGEPWLRERIVDGLDYLGVELDPAANAVAGDGDDIAAADAPVRVLVLDADEERVIAGTALETACAARGSSRDR